MLLALASGVLLTLAYPPLALWPLAWVALAPLYVSLRAEPRPWRAFWRGYGFGGTLFLIGMDWMGQIGSVPWVILSFIEATWFGLYALFASAVLGRARLPVWARPLVFAALWTVIEYARHVGRYSFPWFVLAATQVRAPILLPIVSVTGQWGLTFLVALAGGLVGEAWIAARGKERRPRAVLPLLAAALAVPVFAAAVGAICRLTLSGGDTGQYRVLTAAQGSILKEADFGDADYRDGTMAVYARLTQEAAASVETPPDVIEWPETVVPGELFQSYDLMRQVRDLARTNATTLLVGTVDVDPNDDELNTAALIDAGGNVAGRYDKQQIVPLGEFFPLRGLLGGIYEQYGVPPHDMVAGTHSGTMNIVGKNGPFRLGVMICYDDVFPIQARIRVREGAQVLTVLTSDETFGTTAGPVQHADLAVLRAVESGRWLLRTAATGVSEVISPAGEIKDSLATNRRGILADRMPLRTGDTPYARFGDWFVVVCAVGILYEPVTARGRTKRTQKPRVAEGETN